MDFLSLEYFVRASEQNGISKVAADSNVAASTISSHIAGLEKELGVALFDHKGKGIQLNEFGEIVYAHAIRLLDLYGEARKRIMDRNDNLNYEVSVSTMTIPKTMPLIIKGFKEQHPEIKLNIAQYQKKKDFADMHCDVMLYSTNEKAATESSKTLYAEPIYLIVSRDNPLAAMGTVDAQLLNDEPFICASEIADFGQMTTRIMRELDIQPRIAIVSDYPSFVMELVASNMGISFQPSLTFRNYNNPNIVPVQIRDYHPVRYINIAWNNAKYRAKAVDTFINYVTDYMNALSEQEQALSKGGQV